MHCVCFRPGTPLSGHALPDLLSCSMDRTMVLWRAEPSSGLWMAETSFGDAGGMLVHCVWCSTLAICVLCTVYCVLCLPCTLSYRWSGKSGVLFVRMETRRWGAGGTWVYWGAARVAP